MFRYIFGQFIYRSLYILRKPQIFCKISTVDLSYVVTVEISQNFVDFSEYMNFRMEQKSNSPKLAAFHKY